MAFKNQKSLKKNEKKLRLKKLKKIRKLVCNEDLYFACLERFESHYEFFRLKFRFYNFCENFIPDFENLHYLLYLNESQDDASEVKDLKNDISEEITDLNTSFSDDELNVRDNAAKMLDGRLQSNFVSKNVVNLSKRNLTDSEISLLCKGLNFVPTSNTIDKAKLKRELEALGRMLRLKWHFRNEEKDFDPEKFKPKSTFNPRNKDAAIEIYMSSLEEKLMKIEIPKDKFNNLTSKERKALYDLKNDKNIIIKGADKGSAVVAWDREDYIKEAEKQLGVSDVYEEVPDDAEPLISTIHTTLEKIRKRGDLKKENIQYFEVKDPKFARFYLLPRFYLMYLADQSFLIVVITPKIFQHF